MNKLPEGPIQFKVLGVGFTEGNYMLHCQVNAWHVMRFRWRLGHWFVGEPVIENILGDEEQVMLNEIWNNECKRLLTFEGASKFLQKYYLENKGVTNEN